MKLDEDDDCANYFGSYSTIIAAFVGDVSDKAVGGIRGTACDQSSINDLRLSPGGGMEVGIAGLEELGQRHHVQREPQEHSQR